MMPDPPMLKRPLLSDFLDDYVGTPTDLAESRHATWQYPPGFADCHEKADIHNKAWVVDIDASPRFASAKREINPIMTYARLRGCWATSKRRRVNTAEQSWCHGFPAELIAPLKLRRAMGSLAGNARCALALTHIRDALLLQLGI